MVAAMQQQGGVGLAAPQIGQCVRVILINTAMTGEPSANLMLVNPILLGHAAAGAFADLLSAVILGLRLPTFCATVS